MSLYQAESFYRARILTSITNQQTVPITIRVSTLPVRTSGLLTISSNTEYEEIVEFGNVDAVNGTIDILKRGISPSCIALTVAGTDYNNPSYYRQHTANETIRGDVNHIHINQGIGNSTLATNVGVGIVRLSTAATDPADPIVVGTNDTRVADSSTTNKGISKLSVAPVSASNPIACGDNDPRLAPTDATLTFSDITTNDVSTTKHGFAPKAPNNSDVFLDGLGAYARAVPSGATIQWLTNSAPTGWLLADGTAVSRTTYATLFGVIGTTYGSGDGSTTFNLPNLKGRIAVGRDSAQTEFDTLGETGGAKTHTLTESEMPSHRHRFGIVDGGSAGNYYAALTQGQYTGGYADNFGGSIGQAIIENTGGGAAHNNLQPYIVLNYIIKQ